MSKNRIYASENPDSTFEINQEDSANHTLAQLDETDDIQGTDNFVELFEESLKSIQEGEVVSGEIVQLDKEYALVDIG